MIPYKVEFSDAAEAELIESIIWGIEVWGEEATFRWARNFRNRVQQLLSQFPHGQTIAPESENYPTEIRQMIVGRYRVLFEVQRKTVWIIHIVGSFSETSEEADD